MTALLLSLIGLSLRLVLPRLTRKRFMVVVFVAIAVWIKFDAVFLWTTDLAISFLGDSNNALKVKEIRDLVVFGSSGFSVDARSETYLDSLKLVYEHPLFGIVLSPLHRVGTGVTGFGQHSQIIDTFALFGLPVGLLQLYLLYSPLVKFINFRDRTSSISLVIFLVMLILSTFNNLTPSIGFAVYFLYPVLHDEIFKTHNKLIYV